MGWPYHSFDCDLYIYEKLGVIVVNKFFSGEHSHILSDSANTDMSFFFMFTQESQLKLKDQRSRV